MVSACLVATISAWNGTTEDLNVASETEADDQPYDSLDGPSEEEAFLQGNGAVQFLLNGH